MANSGFSFPKLIVSGIAVWLVLMAVFYFILNPLGLDVFNAVNSLFAALAFAAIIYTVNQQKDELALQRKELADTRKEFELQNQTLRKQRFESTFFSMLSLHHEITSKISLPSGSGEFIGRQAIWLIYENFKGIYLERIRAEGNPPIRSETAEKHISFIADSFFKTYIDNERHLRHYFRNLATLITFVHQSDLVAKNERGLYYDIITSQVNSDEIALMHYYFNVGLGTLERDIFNQGFAGRLNSTLLADISHSYLLDPPLVYQAALAGGKEYFIIRESENG